MRNAGFSYMNNLYKNIAIAQRDKDGKTDVSMPTFNGYKQVDTTQGDCDSYKRISRLTNGSLPSGLNDAVNMGGHYVYTKEDAWSKLNNGTIKIDKAFLKEHEIDIATPINTVESMKENGISNSTDFLWSDIDMGYASSNIDELEKSIDCIASRYVVMKGHINSEYSSEEKIANLNRLEQMMNEHKQSLAQNFADNVSSIFEENGVLGEKDRLYQSVLIEIDQKTTCYSEFSNANKDYAKINGPVEKWLKKDSAYMASELRKAMGNSNISQTKNTSNFDGYTLDEMNKMQTFVNELASYTQYVSGSSKAVHTGSESEESLGMKLAELNLKGTVFNEHSGVSDTVKSAVSKCVNNFITTAINKEQEYMEKWSQLQIEGYEKLIANGEISKVKANEHIFAIKKCFAKIDEDAVYAVINKVENSYKQTKNVTKAIMDGAIFAQDVYNKKTRNGSYDGIHRYDSRDVYWNSFFENKDTYYGENTYIQKESGLECVINSWNSFTEKITSDNNAFLKTSEFLVTA